MNKNSDLTTRKRVGAVVDKKIWENFSELSNKTRIPKSKLMDEALTDLLGKYDFRTEEKEQ